MAINNVELISDRPIEVNLREIAEVHRDSSLTDRERDGARRRRVVS